MYRSTLECVIELVSRNNTYIYSKSNISYFCSERRTKLCHISKLLTDEVRLLDIYFKERSTNCYILKKKLFCL